MTNAKPTVGNTGLRNGQPFTVDVEFLSDWACGTGTGRHGAVDREVQRDADGLPMLRGKALAAVLRDAAETVATGLDGGVTGTWHDWVEAVFGSQPGASSRQRLGPGKAGEPRPQPRSTPVPAALQARPLRLPEEVRRAVAAFDDRDRVLAREAAVLLRPGVQIDQYRHTAADDMFRVEERAAVGLTVTTDWQLSFAGLAVGELVPWEAELLLLAAARLVDAVGGKRRRGAGRCRVTIAGDGASGTGDGTRLADLLRRIDQAKTPAEAMPTTVAETADTQTAETQTADTMLGAKAKAAPEHRHDLRITALTPLMVARGVLGNLVLSERFVPGTSLLPMVAKALGDRATELITSGQVVVTNATVEVDGKRSLPLPRALHQFKDADPEQSDEPPVLVNLLKPRTDDGQRLRTMPGFCIRDTAGGGGIRIAEADLVTQAHAVIDDASQRPTEDSGGLFIHEAIAAGTVLRCELWLPADTRLDTEWLNREHAIGRSRKDDYGHVRVEVIDRPGEPALTSRSEDPANGELVVWLLSDLLLRGPAGAPVTSLDQLGTVLGAALGIDLTLPEQEPGQPPAEFVTTRRVESWQRRWSMPRPSLTGIAAGSVVRFQMSGVPDDGALRRVEATGLGERTAEGYGRLALQPWLLGEETVRLSAPDDQSKGGSNGSRGGEGTARRWLADDVPALAVELLRRGWRRELHRTAAVRAADDALRDLLVPGNATAAQLGVLRTLADRLTAGDGPAQLRGWIAATRRNPPRMQVWGERRLDQLALLAGGHEELWTHLGVRPPEPVAGELHRQAAGWLLTEVARAEVERRRNPTTDDDQLAGPQADRNEEVPA
ncbi:CRISPR-associated protein Csx10 [Micromonospora sp. Llam0]|uniref:RAMP superfamily CRISPR-associated protein n=1 Tax=Micromonospora sp. Llam0 TaxID=2485143 RepID=UPI000F4A97E9|nr:RAMP superfamily CRISPR-associated protein [Micromonospora sp. Llam0]ROO61305.1 CRISPR-associated protein Csx10 [Micromonospora sp. Llam0]